MKADLHVHTLRSKDGAMSADQIIGACRERGLGCVAITDHNSLAGARMVRQRVQEIAADLIVIPGEEVRTSEGELLAYFIEEEIPARLSVQETLERIKRQGGIVGVSHPCDRLRHGRLDPAVLREIVGELDCIEVFNARVIFPADNLAAKTFADAHGLPGTAGSDAHFLYELGGGYVEMDPFCDKGGFLASLASARVQGHLASPLVHAHTRWLVWSRLLKKRLGG